MKNKILILTVVIVFVIGMISINRYLENNTNETEISKNEESIIEIMKVTSANFESEVLKSEKTVLIDFYADWCGPCRTYSPIVKAFSKENTGIKVVKVDIDEEQDIANKYQIISIPTTVVIKNGKETNRALGIINKSDLAELVK